MSPTVLSASSDFFLRRFCQIAIVSSLVLLALSAYASFKLYEGYVVRLAESNAVNLASSISNAHHQVLTSALEKAPLLPPQLQNLDTTLRAFLEPYGILKVKLFSTDSRVIYSNDLSIIGRVSENNAHLEIALAGGSSSLIQNKNQIRDMSHEERFNVDVVETYVAMTDTQGRVVGVFEIYQDMTAFREEVRHGVTFFVSGLTVILALVIASAFYFMRGAAKKMISQQRQLEHMATIDLMTNLYNRAEITRRMEAEWERYKRNGEDRGFGLLMLDIDHFKAVNDQYGHQVGDEVLRHVAHRLKGELRLYSDIGRYGGEEFMLLLPDVTLSGLSSIADRIRKLISEEPFEISDKEIAMTVSVGIAVAEARDLNLDALIKRADDHLYQAKSDGRDCVVGGDSSPLSV